MPVRNFNDRRRAQERVSFVIGPDEHEFKCRMRVRPEAILEYEKMDTNAPSGEVLLVVDQLIRDLLMPEELPAWDALRARDDDDAVELDELADLAAYLVEQVVNRPLAQASPSSATPSTIGTSSTDESPSQEAVASAG